MAEKIYPASKPNTGPTPAASAGNPSFPATKAQLYNHTRPVYRPQPRRSRRSCCCCLFLWIVFIAVILCFIAAITGGVMYVLYRPHRPVFAVSSLHVSQMNLTSSNKLTTKFNITITARNPNKKIVFVYDTISVHFNTKDVNVGDGSITAFTMGKKNTTILRSIVSVTGQDVDADKSSGLKTDLKSKKSLILKVQLDTKVKAKIGSLKTKKLPIRVSCDGIKAVAPSGKTATTATVSDAKCKVDLRIKIWKFTI
uniref:NDR1/HIN1-like protein 13 n=1 Tax=Erigeron canadensis TaxID=72917 RepID=UPI001CB90A44|nr:NDR1/HIN1-like protein 13 [Erigeron canadensis]